MTVFVCLLIGNETWHLQEKSIKTIRLHHPDQDIIVYYSLSEDCEAILKTLNDLQVETVDIGRPGLLRSTSAGGYSNYNSLDFNIKTSFKWLAILGAMSTRLRDVIFIDADIILLSPLPLDVFRDIWVNYDILIQDEGINIFPKHPCTGFMGIKCCESNISLLERLHKEQCAAIVSDASMHDQTIFYSLISRDIEVYKTIYFLPQLLFPVGYMGPVYERFNSAPKGLARQGDPIIYHANWIVGIEGKAALLNAMLKDENDDTTNSKILKPQAAESIEGREKPEQNQIAKTTRKRGRKS
jgi:hypothetical protein